MFCDKWLNDFSAFLIDMGSACPKNYTLERMNRTGNYESGNCIWATRKTQANNMSTNHIIQVNDEYLTMQQAAEKYNINYSTLRGRLRAGWTIKEAFQFA